MEVGPRGGLWDVFSACDEDGDGWVDVGHFVRLAASHLPSEQEAVALGRLLDPKGLGLIDFDAFCRGVSAFGGGGTAHLADKEHHDGDDEDCDHGDDDDDGRRDGYNGGLGPDWDEVGEVTDSAYLGSESAPSETETLPDEETSVTTREQHQQWQQWEVAPSPEEHPKDHDRRPRHSRKAASAESGAPADLGDAFESRAPADLGDAFESRAPADLGDAFESRAPADLGDAFGYLQMGGESASPSHAELGLPGAEEEEGGAGPVCGDRPRHGGTPGPDATASTPPGSGSQPGVGARVGRGDLPGRHAPDAGYLSRASSAAAVDGSRDVPGGRGVGGEAPLPSDASQSTEPTGSSDRRRRDATGDLGEGEDSPRAVGRGDLPEAWFESGSRQGLRNSPRIGDGGQPRTSGRGRDPDGAQDGGASAGDFSEVGAGAAPSETRGLNHASDHRRHYHHAVPGHREEDQEWGRSDGTGPEPNPAVNGVEEFEESGDGEEATAAAVRAPRRHDLSASDTWSLRAPSYGSRFSTSSPASAGEPGGRQGARGEDGDEGEGSYCLCCRQRIARLKELDRRLTQLHLTGPRQRISTKAFARRLQPGGHRKSASCSNQEDFFGESPDTGSEVNQRMSLLESKVLELESDSVITCDLQTQIKQENTTLIHRINELEDRLRETEVRSELRSHEVSLRHQEVLARVERHKLSELEALRARLLQVEEEGSALKATVAHLKTLAHRLTEEKEALAERLEESVCRLSEEVTLGRTLADKLRQDEQRFQHEHVATHELIEELRRELEGLQLLRLEAERGTALGGARRRLGSSTGLQEYQARTREVELEHEVRRLRQERQRLQEQNEDLSGQIISTSLQGAKSLLSVPTRSQALASNPDGATHEEVVAALHEVEEINDQLRQYMDRVILAILETNPSILEVKP
ncbi:uncharacterized protein LOC116946204 isoform X2 [Petromyzon marinus]|uniref:Rab11 family-interacting protein 4A-like isoform X2 n=1 Tax=Petromyzon marinus TaxID=7757 RepID=A0AAJ7TFU4_PETMA|nr:rab11 family-interacting protein 4A-like isoform X2 [Petromyzon marinus]